MLLQLPNIRMCLSLQCQDQNNVYNTVYLKTYCQIILEFEYVMHNYKVAALLTTLPQPSKDRSYLTLHGACVAGRASTL